MFRIFIKIQLIFVADGLIVNVSPLPQAVAWCQISDKPLRELMMTRLDALPGNTLTNMGKL